MMNVSRYGYHSITNKFHRFEKKRNVIFRYIITNKAIVVFEFNNTAKISAFSSLETHVALIKVALFLLLVISALQDSEGFS